MFEDYFFFFKVIIILIYQGFHLTLNISEGIYLFFTDALSTFYRGLTLPFMSLLKPVFSWKKWCSYIITIY